MRTCCTVRISWNSSETLFRLWDVTTLFQNRLNPISLSKFCTQTSIMTMWKSCCSLARILRRRNQMYLIINLLCSIFYYMHIWQHLHPQVFLNMILWAWYTNFWTVSPIILRWIFQEPVAEWEKLLHSHFHISPEKFNGIHSCHLAGLLKVALIFDILFEC